MLCQDLSFSDISGTFLLQTQDPPTPSHALKAPQKRRHIDLLVSPVVCAVGVISQKTVANPRSWRLASVFSYKEKKFTARRSNQSILKEISPECSLEGLMLKLKLQYFGHLMKELTHWKRPWCWERLKVGGEGDDRGWDGWMASPTWWTGVWVSARSWWRTGKPGVLQSMGSQRIGHD